MPRRVQTFEVSLKAFIRRGDRALLVQEADTGYWELPGGRIDAGEEWQDHAAILARELAEELGAGFRVEIGTRAVSLVRQRPADGVFQFIVVRVCTAPAGEPRLSAEHAAFRWVSRDEALGLALPPQSSFPAALTALWALGGGPGRPRTRDRD